MMAQTPRKMTEVANCRCSSAAIPRNPPRITIAVLMYKLRADGFFERPGDARKEIADDQARQQSDDESRTRW